MGSLSYAALSFYFVIPGLVVVLMTLVGIIIKRQRSRTAIASLTATADDFCKRYSISTLPSNVSVDRRGRLQFISTWYRRTGEAVLGNVYVFWIAAGALAVLLTNSILYLVERDLSHSASMTVKSACIGLTPCILELGLSMLSQWCKSVLQFVTSRPPTAIIQWFNNGMLAINNERRMWAFALTFSIAVGIFEWIDQAFVQTDLIAKAAMIIISSASTVACGSAVYYLIGGCMLISRVGEFEVWVEPHPFGVMATGRMLVRIFLLVTTLYLAYTLTAPLRPTWEGKIIWVWVAIAGTLIVTMFLLPQIRIHETMLEYKHSQLRTIEKRIREASDRFQQQPTTDNAKILQGLKEHRRDIIDLPEWPFDWLNLVNVLTISVSPSLITALINLLIPFFPTHLKAVLDVLKTMLNP